MSDARETAICSFTGITHFYSEKYFQMLRGNLASLSCTKSNIAIANLNKIFVKNSKNDHLNHPTLFPLCTVREDPSLRERLRTHKVFTKDRCFYLNYHKFSIKSYVLDVY